jgi:hypothetical protein
MALSLGHISDEDKIVCFSLPRKIFRTISAASGGTGPSPTLSWRKREVWAPPNPDTSDAGEKHPLPNRKALFEFDGRSRRAIRAWDFIFTINIRKQRAGKRIMSANNCAIV